jgi:hypothetical protein
MLEDGTWKQELGEKDQITALTTKLTEIQAKFDQQIAPFATQTKDEKGAATASTSNFNSSGIVFLNKILTQLRRGALT